jgi:hypothetical protein
MFKLVKTDKEKINMISISVVPIKFGFSLLVNRMIIPKAKES